VRGVPPAIDLDAEGRLQRLLVDVIGRGLVRSAHDCAEGGLAVTLAECCFESGGIGVDVSVPAADTATGTPALAGTLFGESASRVVVSVAKGSTEALLAAARAAGVPAAVIGTTGGAAIRIAIDGRAAVDLPVDAAETRWSTSLAQRLDGRAA
jgi:phosphoribosylformylglycinamidine synthase